MLKELSMPVRSPGKGLLEAYIWLSPDDTYEPFPFGDFVLHPFTIINHSYKYDLILSFVSPSE